MRSRDKGKREYKGKRKRTKGKKTDRKGTSALNLGT
jgi:hypothetical protein